MRTVFCELTGQKLHLPHRCERVVSFSPAVTETLFLAGLGDRVVGVSAFCVRPEAARKKTIVGSYDNFKEATLRELAPDLVFTTTGYQMGLLRKLATTFPVYAVRLPPTVAAVIATCVEAVLVAGHVPAARALEQRLLAALGDLLAEPVRPSKAPRVYVEIDLGGPVTFGAYSYITDALELLGAQPAFGDEPREWLVPDGVRLQAHPPDLVIYEPKMFSSRRQETDVRALLRPRLGELAHQVPLAVTPGPYDFLAHHGPSFILEAMPWVSKVLAGLA